MRDLANGWSSSLAGMGLRVDLDYTADVGLLPNPVRVAAYRIAAEAVTNVVRHANARWCRIEVDTSAGSLRMRVVDDGIGQDGRTSGVGRRSMLDRAQAVGGDLRISAYDAAVPAGQRGRGTVVEASFPQSEEL